MTTDGPIRLPRNPAMPALESERACDALIDALRRIPPASAHDWFFNKRTGRIVAYRKPGWDANGSPTSEFDK